MDVVRTPDGRFADLPDYPFEPRYVETSDGLRLHYVEVGPSHGPAALLLHGQPTWSYLYRHVLQDLADRGIRAIAPDLIGYGRSDKPTERTAYSFKAHIGWVSELIRSLDLQGITLVAQDWGGPIGLGSLTRTPERFGAVVAANTILHTADEALDGKLTWTIHGTDDERVVVQEALLDYVLMSLRQPVFTASVLVDFATTRQLTAAELAAYDAPFPDESHQAGLRQMSALIPFTRNDPGARINRKTIELLRGWDKPFVTAYSDNDPPTRGWDVVFRELVPHATSHPLRGGHFLQEDSPTELAEVIARTHEAPPST